MCKSYFYLILLLCFAAFACNEEDKIELLPEPEKFPTSFKFITVNNSSIYSDPASLTYVSHSGDINPNIYHSANGKTWETGASQIERVNDKFLFTYSGIDFKTYYSNCYIEILDTATFCITDVIDLSYKKLGYELMINSTAKMDNDHVVAAGTLCYPAGGDGDNIAIICLKTQSVGQHARLDFPINKVIYHKGKVFTFGPKSDGRNSKIAVLDTDNISAEPRILSDQINLFSGNSQVIVDSKNRIWIAAMDTEGAAVFCINPDTETITHRIALPHTISPLTSVGMTIDKGEKNIYIRAGRAFYRIDMQTLEAPDDVEFEVTTGIVDGGMQCMDLKTALDGKLLFIREISGKGEICQVYELDPETTEVTNIYPTNINSRYIYIAK